MKASLLTRMEKLELFMPLDDEAMSTTRILFVGSDEYIEVRLSGHPSQREKAQMTFHNHDMQGANS